MVHVYLLAYNVMSQLSDWKRAHMCTDARTYVRTRVRTYVRIMLYLFVHLYRVHRVPNGTMVPWYSSTTGTTWYVCYTSYHGTRVPKLAIGTRKVSCLRSVYRNRHRARAQTKMTKKEGANNGRFCHSENAFYGTRSVPWYAVLKPLLFVS